MGESEEVRAAATIGGAPISWVAIIGALMGVGSMIPLVYYVEGGGYHSLAKAMYVPTVAILGPWGGVAAIFIGAIIAAFFAPAIAQWYSIVFDFVLLSLCIGWILNGDRKGLLGLTNWLWCIPFWVGGVIWFNLYPWYWPGHDFIVSIGLADPPQPFFTMSNWFDYSSIIIVLVFGRKIIPTWVRGDDPKKMALAIGLTVWGSEISHLWGWGFWTIQFGAQPDLIAVLSAFSVPVERLILAAVAGVVGVPLLQTLRRSGLRAIPGAAW